MWRNILFLICFCFFSASAFADIPGSITINTDIVQTDLCKIDIGGNSSNVILDVDSTNTINANKHTLDTMFAFDTGSVTSMEVSDPIDPGRYSDYAVAISSNYIDRPAAIPKGKGKPKPY